MSDFEFEVHEQKEIKTTKSSKKDKDKDTKNNKKRNRVPISCTICRRRKVKCDKRRPVCAACERTGVAHLCHYIDPPWAQPLSNEELTNGETADNEVERLKEKIAQLEQQLQHSHHHDVPLSPQELSGDSSSEENENDSLNLGKKFDMLHIKSTTTVHLGATSWLAIMKGDPYLRVLWAHIFKMRKQVEEFKFRKHARPKPSQNTIIPSAGTTVSQPRQSGDTSQGTSIGKCPVAHTEIFKNTTTQKQRSPVQSKVQPQQTCPVSGKAQGMGKCPVSHDLEENDEAPVSIPSAKRAREDDTEDGDDDRSSSENKETPATEEDDRVCPLMIGDNRFLGGFQADESGMNFGVPLDNPHKKKKTARSNSSDSTKSAGRKVSPDDFKANPVDMMKKYLPTKKVLWLFIERFFEVLYVYLPYVDEETFKEDVKRIMGSADDKDQNITMNIRSGIDFALVGTVCIILRLVWNTLPINNSNKILGKSINTKTYPEDQEALAILQKPENEIPLELVECVKHCFSNLKLMRKSSLKIVQCALYMRFYFMYSPEDGDGADGGDSQIFLGMIIQMAISIGLHRDPKNFENFGNERQRHLWRKIWFALVSLDVSQSVNLGCPRGLQGHDEFSDTMVPGAQKDGLDLEEFKDDMRELSVIKNIHTQAKLDTLISKTMKVLLNVNSPAKRTQVDALIKELQHSISGFGVTQDEFALPQLGKILVHRAKSEPLFSSGTRAIQFRAHVMVNMLIYLLNYILYVHFEPRGAQDAEIAVIAKNYAQKALNCALEGYRNCTLFFDCGLEYFGPGADLILSPLLLLVGHRSMQFMVSLILRSRCGPYMRATVVQNTTEKNTGNGSISPSNTRKNIDGNGVHEIDNTNHDLDNIEIKDDSASSIFDVDVNSGEMLATILLDHMVKFEVLSEKLGKKYPYSWRMAKAVYFFITLLKKPTNSVKSIVKTENVKRVENNTGEVSTLLNSVPLVLSADEEELRKCPVFMRAEESATRSTANNRAAGTLLATEQCPHKHHKHHIEQMSQAPPHMQQRLQAHQQEPPLQPPTQQMVQDLPPTASSPGFGIFSVPTPEYGHRTASATSPFPFMNAGSATGLSEIDGSDLPAMAPPEALADLNDVADRSLGDMFGVNLNAGNPAGAGGFISEMANMNLDPSEMGIPPMDFNAMINGNWFS